MALTNNYATKQQRLKTPYSPLPMEPLRTRNNRQPLHHSSSTLHLPSTLEQMA